jgi:hypothetical protein
MNQSNAVETEEGIITLREDDPIRALCYLEGYIERIMHEQGLEVEQGVKDKFNIVYRHITASVMQIINTPMSAEELTDFINSYKGTEIR